jgi:hypothetical protein
MNERIKTIYTYLYENNEYCTKSKLADILDVNPKTIDNTFKSLGDEIIFDKKLERYRFNTLLPKYIPYKVFYKIFQDSIANNTVKEDFLRIEEMIDSENNILMIETHGLSESVQKIIMFTMAINGNFLLRIEYGKPRSNEIEVKYIQPNTLFTNGFTYYGYITYDEKNKINIGEQRTLAISRISKMEIEEHIIDKIFKIDQKGNAFGPFNKKKYILLEFDMFVRNFFQKEKMFGNGQFEIVEADDVDENFEIFTVKMYYNSLNIEVIKIIQQWMPHIKVHPTDENRSLIYEEIKKNYTMLGI